jgi:hypothetical protein
MEERPKRETATADQPMERTSHQRKASSSYTGQKITYLTSTAPAMDTLGSFCQKYDKVLTQPLNDKLIYNH